MDNHNLEYYLAKHYIHRSNWIRATVLGANDGIISIACLIIGMASAGADKQHILLAGVAGLVAGALSMAAGEYVSVSSQTDIENADIEREKLELKETPELELKMLAKIYIDRGLREETAIEVAKQLTEHDALKAHIRDELGIVDNTRANPLQAAFASFISFFVGGLLPLALAFFATLKYMVYLQYGFAILFLMLLGIVTAKSGGSNVSKAVLRISFWGTVAMLLTAFVGYLFGTQV